MSDLTTVLAQLFDKNTVTVASLKRDVTVKKVTLRTLKPVTALLGVFLEDMKAASGEGTVIDMNEPSFILKLISKYYDDVITIVLSLSDTTEDELLDLPADESVLIIQAIMVLNKTFFTEKVLPNLRLVSMEEATVD